MTQNYSSYRGRGSGGRKFLIFLIIVLLLALIGSILWFFVLPNYIVYTADGPQLKLPFLSAAAPTSTPGPEVEFGGNNEVEVPPTQAPTPTPEPTPEPTPTPTMYPRRDMTLGLVYKAGSALMDGTAGESLSSGQGALVSAAELDLAQGKAITEANLALSYAAVYVPLTKEDVEGETGLETCLTLSGMAFDELVLAPPGVQEVDHAALRDFYNSLKEKLDALGYEGRLSLELDQGFFASSAQGLVEAIAGRFDRLYFRTTLTNANSAALRQNGFTANGYTLVTVVRNPANLNYAWAVLPPRS